MGGITQNAEGFAGETGDGQHSLMLAPSDSDVFRGRPCITQQDKPKPPWLRSGRVTAMNGPACSSHLS